MHYVVKTFNVRRKSPTNPKIKVILIGIERNQYLFVFVFFSHKPNSQPIKAGNDHAGKWNHPGSAALGWPLVRHVVGAVTTTGLRRQHLRGKDESVKSTGKYISFRHRSVDVLGLCQHKSCMVWKICWRWWIETNNGSPWRVADCWSRQEIGSMKNEWSCLLNKDMEEKICVHIQSNDKVFKF